VYVAFRILNGALLSKSVRKYPSKEARTKAGRFARPFYSKIRRLIAQKLPKQKWKQARPRYQICPIHTLSCRAKYIANLMGAIAIQEPEHQQVNNKKGCKPTK
jgi:hypothetical protein